MFTTQRLQILVVLFLTLLGLRVNAQIWPADSHDPSSIIKCGNKYWIFSSGDGITTKYSTDMVTWTAGKTPFTTSDFPTWVMNYATTLPKGTTVFTGNFWAPDIIYMNNQYYLYYTASIWASMYSCIGVAVNTTLDPDDKANYKWVDQGDIGIHSCWTCGDNNVNAIDPAIMRGHDGKIWLTYGSFNSGGIMVTEVDSTTGKPKGAKVSVANSWKSAASPYGEGEGGAMIYHEGYYYVFYDKGGCCSGLNSSYYIVMGRSQNPQGPFVDKEGKNMRVIGAPSGGTIFFKHDDAKGLEDRYYGPGHFALYRENGIDYVTFHYYMPPYGWPALGQGKLKWEADGWPTMSFDFLEKGIYTLTNVNSNKVMDLQNQSLTDATPLFQYSKNEDYDTQKWLFNPLGTGEYTIRSYADTTKYIQATGNNNNELLTLTSTYSGSSIQKFRLMQSPNGKIIIYPSTKETIFEIPNALKTDNQIKLWANASNYDSSINTDHQRWNVTRFVDELSTSSSDVSFSYHEGIFEDISVSSNGDWVATVEDPTWLEINPLSGRGNQTFSFYVTENLLETVRTNKITIRSRAGNQTQIMIYQQTQATVTTSVSNRIEDNFDIYPNPTSGMIWVKCKESAILEIYNPIGNLILSQNLDSNTKIDASNLQSGIYLFKLIQKDGVRIKKVLKQ